jgi:hypothetical protein
MSSRKTYVRWTEPGWDEMGRALVDRQTDEYDCCVCSFVGFGVCTVVMVMVMVIPFFFFVGGGDGHAGFPW